MDQATILVTALAMIDEEGLEGLTMRRLGDRLDMSAMAAYRYFDSKDAVLDALVDSMVERWRLPAEQLDPDPHERVLGAARRVRATLLEHPALAQVVLSRPLRRERALEDLTTAVDRLTEAGFPRDAIAQVTVALAGFTLGMTAWQCGTHDRAAGQPSYDDDRERFLAMAEAADPGAPMAGILRLAVDRSGDDGVFELALTSMYDGLCERFGVQRPPASTVS